ncbi:MAG: hypothetical protein AB1796_03585 [Bacillota bacterium]
MVRPADYLFDGDKIVWSWKDLDPEHNIEVIFNTRGLRLFLQWNVPEEIAALPWEEKLNKGYYAALLNEVFAMESSGKKSECQSNLPIYRALALQGLGDVERAARAWEQVLEQA